jgi:hypothetical protein
MLQSRRWLLTIGMISLCGAAFSSRTMVTGQAPRARVLVSLPAAVADAPLDGRLLLLISKRDDVEPRFAIGDTLNTQQVFGIDVEGWHPGQDATFDAGVLGYPQESLANVPRGTYTVQVLLHRYETFRRADGHVVKLPMEARASSGTARRATSTRPRLGSCSTPPPGRSASRSIRWCRPSPIPPRRSSSGTRESRASA